MRQYSIFISQEFIKWQIENLDHCSVSVFYALLYYMSYKTATAFPSYKTLKALTKLSDRSIARAVKHLIDLKVITIENKPADTIKRNYKILVYINNVIVPPKETIAEVVDIDTLIDKEYNLDR